MIWLIDNKIANKITQVSRSSPQNNLETTANKHDKEIPKERSISPEERQKNIDNLIQLYNNGISKNNEFLR